MLMTALVMAIMKERNAHEESLCLGTQSASEVGSSCLNTTGIFAEVERLPRSTNLKQKWHLHLLGRSVTWRKGFVNKFLRAGQLQYN